MHRVPETVHRANPRTRSHKHTWRQAMQTGRQPCAGNRAPGQSERAARLCSEPAHDPTSGIGSWIDATGNTSANLGSKPRHGKSANRYGVRLVAISTDRCGYRRYSAQRWLSIYADYAWPCVSVFHTPTTPGSLRGTPVSAQTPLSLGSKPGQPNDGQAKPIDTVAVPPWSYMSRSHLPSPIYTNTVCRPLSRTRSC